MKKIMTAVFASALAMALAAPAAFACSEHKTAQEKDQSGVVAQEDKAANEKKAEQAPKAKAKAAKKKAPAKVARAEKKQQKKPVRVSQN